MAFWMDGFVVESFCVRPKCSALSSRPCSQPHTQPPLYNRYLAALYLLNCLVLVGTQVTQAPPVDWYPKGGFFGERIWKDGKKAPGCHGKSRLEMVWLQLNDIECTIFLGTSCGPTWHPKTPNSSFWFWFDTSRSIKSIWRFQSWMLLCEPSQMIPNDSESFRNSADKCWQVLIFRV
jgi:hypothetical protein